MAGLFPQAGFYYQNIVAAHHILDIINIGNNIQTIELDNFDKAEHIDDIIITYKDGFTKFFQVKWSGDNSSSYTLYNLAVSADDTEKSLIEQLAEGYLRLSNKTNVEIYLYTNRPAGNTKQKSLGFTQSLSSFLKDVHLQYIQGDQVSQLIDLPNFSEYQDTIAQLSKASKLEQEAEFCQFLHKLRFQFNQPIIEIQRQRLKNKLDQLGIEQSIYDTLLNGVVEWSLPPRQEITSQTALERLGLAERFADRLVQDFRVDITHYIKNESLFKQLDNVIAQVNSGFIFLEGAPGSGKSTALTMYQRQREEISFTYYCYIPDETYIGNARMERETFLKSLCIELQNAFPDIEFPQKYSQNYESKLNIWLKELSQHVSKAVLIVDGLDHVERKAQANQLTEPLTNALSGILPDNIVIIISAQYIEAIPVNVRSQIQSSDLRHIIIPKFSEAEVRTYFNGRGIQFPPKLLPLITEITAGIPLYVHYIANKLQAFAEHEFDHILHEFPTLEDNNINTYHTYLYDGLSSDEELVYILAVLSHRKEYTDIDTLFSILEIMNRHTTKYLIEKNLGRIKHLLNISDAKNYAIMHDSFRQFILSQSQSLRDEVNEALIGYYQSQPKADQTYRNYFRHLFELGRYQQILQECDRIWLEQSWNDFRPFQEITINLDLAWKAAIETESFRDYVRIAFLKYQIHLIQYYVEEITDFKAHEFLLEMNKPQEALRTVWDGVRPSVTQQEFAKFIESYIERTGKKIPDRIAMTILEHLPRQTSAEELKIFSAARAHYPGWHEHFEQVTEFKWMEADTAPQIRVKKEMSPDKNREMNSSIQIVMLKSLFISEDFEGLAQIAGTTKYGQAVKLHALLYSLNLLLKAGEIQEAIDMIRALDSTDIEQNIHNQIILLFARYKSYSNISSFVTKTFPSPLLFEGLLQESASYKIKDDLFELYDSLRVCFLQDANSYYAYMLRVSTHETPAKEFLTSIIELAQLWRETALDNLDESSKLSKCKEILNHLNIDKKNIKTSNTNHFETIYIAQDIHRVYILLFDYLVEQLKTDQIILVIQHWLLLDGGSNGYKSSTIHIEFAKRLSKLNQAELQPFIGQLLERSEAFSRLDEGTSTLVSELLQCAKAYGYCGFTQEANRLWQEIYEIACGISDRKDYQFNEAISALELVHQKNPAKSRERIARLLHLAHQLLETGGSNLVARAIEYLIAFASSINIGLGLELLHQEDDHVSREYAIQSMTTALIERPTTDLRPLWQIIKTMDKWHDFRVYRDTTVPTMLNFFKTTLERKNFGLAEEIYEFCRHQFLVEKDMPQAVFDFAEACREQNFPIRSSESDFSDFKASKEKALEQESGQNKLTLPKEFTRLKKVNYEIFFQLSENNFIDFNLEIDQLYEEYVKAERKRDIRRGYYALQQLYEKWQGEHTSDLQNDAHLTLLSKALREYLKFVQKACELPTQISEKEYFELVSNLVEELKSKIQKIIPVESLKVYFEDFFDLKGWKEDITRGGLTSYYGEQEIIRFIDKFIENSSVKNLSHWHHFCKRWLKHGQLTKALIQIAQRLSKLQKERSRELLLESWDANSQFFYESNDSANSFFTTFFAVAPNEAKKLLLQSFFYEHQRYPGTIIRNLDLVTRFAAQFEREDIYDYLYDQYELHNQLLTAGLSEKPTDYSWVENFEPQYSDRDAIILYLVRQFDYPEVEVRKLSLRSLFDLIQADNTIVDRLVLFLDLASDNGKEHILSLIHTLALTQPEWVLRSYPSLLKWLDYPHFNIKQTTKEILLHIINTPNSSIEESQREKILMTNSTPQILVPTLEQVELFDAKHFIPSSYQSRIIAKLHEYNDDDDIAKKLYTRLRYQGWTKEAGFEQERKVHYRHNINTNFDVIEINGPYFKATQEALNVLMNREIRQRSYDDQFINEMRFDFRLYDPQDPLIAIESRPSDIRRVDNEFTKDQFLGFEDLINWSSGWKITNGDLITLYESGHQRTGEVHTTRDKQTCYFTFVAFLASNNLETASLVQSLPGAPFMYLENIYRHELPYLLPTGTSFPISGIKPIIGISKRGFRGEDDLSIAALLPDFAEELMIAPTYDLTYRQKEETIANIIQWQGKYDQDRRRQQPVEAGVRLQIKRQTLDEYLEKGKWNIHYIFNVRRSVDKYLPEEEMNWTNFSRIGKLNLSSGNLSWLS